MQSYEYKVVPAPARGEKERGLKTGAERYAFALSNVMNELAREGWEYWRAESLPSEERAGLTSKVTVEHHLLVFRRGVGVLAQARNDDPAFADYQPRGLSVFAPEGKAPRLGPAEEDRV